MSDEELDLMRKLNVAQKKIENIRAASNDMNGGDVFLLKVLCDLVGVREEYGDTRELWHDLYEFLEIMRCIR